MGLLTITIRTVVRLEKADTACLALIIAMTTMAIRQANQDKTCLAEETSMMLMETKQAIQCKDSLEITTITMMTKKTITKPAKKNAGFFLW